MWSKSLGLSFRLIGPARRFIPVKILQAARSGGLAKRVHRTMTCRWVSGYFQRPQPLWPFKIVVSRASVSFDMKCVLTRGESLEFPRQGRRVRGTCDGRFGMHVSPPMIMTSEYELILCTRHAAVFNKRDKLFVTMHENCICVYEAIEKSGISKTRLKLLGRFDRPGWVTTSSGLAFPSIGPSPHIVFCLQDHLALWRVDTLHLSEPRKDLKMQVQGESSSCSKPR